MKKGITISTLTITVTIMIILISVSTVVGISSIRTASYEEFLSKLTRVSNDVNLYLKKNKELPITNEVVSNSGLNTDLIELLSNNGDINNKLYVVDMNKLNTESVNLGYGTTENMDVFLVAENSNNIYYLKGYKYKGNSYYGNVGKTFTLGDLVVSAADYGKTINYEANGVKDWKVFYEDEEKGYVYLIASEALEKSKVPTNLPKTTVDYSSLTTTPSSDLGEIYWYEAPEDVAKIQHPTIWMAEWGKYDSYDRNINGRCVSYFLDETYWTSFISEEVRYKDYILGAIGTPTAEMFVASWNAKREATKDYTTYKKILLTPNGTNGYYVNNESTTTEYSQYISSQDNLYIWSTSSESSVWLASPSGYDGTGLLFASYFPALGRQYYVSHWTCIRPVICLNSSIPARIGTKTNYVI